MGSEPCWPDPEAIVRLNAILVGDTNEPHLLARPDLLASACERAANRWRYDGETDIASLAATVLLAVAGNHPFLQGNKRTGFAAANLFLEANGYALAVEDSVDFARLIINVLEGKASEAHLADVLRNGVAPVDD